MSILGAGSRGGILSMPVAGEGRESTSPVQLRARSRCEMDGG